MTPLITEMVGAIPDIAADMVWFDIQETWGKMRELYTHDRSMAALQNPLPFNKCAIVGIDDKGNKFMLMAINARRPDSKEEDTFALAISGLIKKEGMLRVLPPFFCDPHNDRNTSGLTIHFEDTEHEKDPRALGVAKSSLVGISFWLELLNTEKVNAHTPVLKSNTLKRIRQGKKPMFDWHTVLIEPPKPKAEAQGGTHASPRLHDVRGHWVNRNGKRYWRKAHQRGDASLGVVFHDYKLKGEAND
jgi:hypothetical protein